MVVGEIIGGSPLKPHSLVKWNLCQMNSFHIAYELHSIIEMGKRGLVLQRLHQWRRSWNQCVTIGDRLAKKQADH